MKIILIFFSVILSFLNSLYAESPVQNAQMTISEKSLYNLHGEWKVKFEDVKNGESLDLDDSDWTFISVPGLWALKGIHYKGIAWYRLHLNISSNLKGEKLGFQVPNILDAHKVYFNGIFIGESGNIDSTLTNFHHNPKSDVYSIEPSIVRYDDKNVISIQMQTFISIGGTANETYFGLLPLVKKEFLTTVIIRSAFSISFIVFSIYIFFSYFGLKEISYIYGSLTFLCFSLVVFTFYQIESLFIDNGFLLYYTLFTFGFGGIYFFQFLFLQKEYGYTFHKIEKIILFIYSIIFLINFIPLVYLPFIEVRNKYLIAFISIFHVLFLIQTFYYSMKTLIDKKYYNYPYSIGFIIIFPFAMQDYLIPFNLKLFHEINSFYIVSVLLVFYSFNLIFKQHFIYKKIINMEKQYSEKLEKEVLIQTKELKETNRNLIQSNNLNNKLFSIISHDLRSPINSLTLVLNLFKNKHLDANQLRENIGELSEVLEKNRFLLENLLNWSYMQLESELLSIEEVDMVPLLKDIYDVMLPTSLEKSIQLDLKISISECFVVSNPHALNLVIINLLSNSIKFTKPDGKIELGLKLESESVTIYVKDDGIGIDSKRLEMIHQEKDILPHLGTKKEKGSGIGLKLCRDILHKLGIQLNISSSLNNGTIVFFSMKSRITESIFNRDETKII